ncbi:hypothetical protein PUNSTDRAFT_63838, partial [Punctularia strigosozonata HHB-11173 SS5]|uniref:uncharacterized protein n=1 Tax=Punctularia strigosozonata (strain HHB-11173) TaxID=741275 RepID=UPI00044162FD
AYIGNDFPSNYDIHVGFVTMDFTETVRYALDEPASAAEWALLQMIPTHQGYVRLGPEKRRFAISMFHSMHCMDLIRRALLDYDNIQASPLHVQHCINYIRQSLLCNADAMLEPGDFLEWNITLRDGDSRHSRQCRDWSEVYRKVDANYRQWGSWTEAHGV